MFEDLRVPSPVDVRRVLRQLVDTEMIRPAREDEKWSLTPVGDRRVSQVMGSLDFATLAPLLADAPGAEFGKAFHTVIPPSLAPAKWSPGIQALIDRYPFESSVLCMTRFPDKEEENLPDPVASAIEIARSVLARHGLHMHLASDRQIDDELWGNVAAHAWASSFGLALFEDLAGEGLNENLIIEVGAMLMTGRRCALLRDKTIDHMPTDLVGQIYKAVNFSNQQEVAQELHRWCREDLALRSCEDCPV